MDPYDSPCPSCGAMADHYCVTRRGKKANKPHAARGRANPRRETWTAPRLWEPLARRFLSALRAIPDPHREWVRATVTYDSDLDFHRISAGFKPLASDSVMGAAAHTSGIGDRWTAVKTAFANETDWIVRFAVDNQTAVQYGIDDDPDVTVVAYVTP